MVVDVVPTGVDSQARRPPPAPPTLEDLRSYVQWMKHAHAELTQREIARLADVHKSSVARLELGQDVTYANASAILRALVAYHEDNLVAPTTPVSEVMTSPVRSAYSTWSLGRLYDEMATQGFTWMPFRDKQRRYTGLIARETVEQLLTRERLDADTPVEKVVDELVSAELPEPLDHEATVAQARDRLERGPAIRLVERFGQVRGVVTPANLERVRWDGS